ncbi:MAG: peptidylprolyl isomerase, partial [Chitinophagaceae bacterium]
MKNKILLSCFALIISFAAVAQPKGILADKIIAVVGNKIILKSDIDNQLLDMQR